MKLCLISVSDKQGIVEFARELIKYNFEIITSSGTSKLLKEKNIPVKEISEFTGSPEMLGGRVKTLHPLISGGILADRERDKEDINKYNIKPIDLVVCNLYPFVEKPCIENIDIGGVTLIRACAKNYKYTTCCTSKDQYPQILKELKEFGEILQTTRLEFAKKAFVITSNLDSKIGEFFEGSTGKMPVLPDDTLTLNLPDGSQDYKKIQELRYGENPHQSARLYEKIDNRQDACSITKAKKLWGKELSFNNIYDLDTALAIIKDFNKPCVCILKHANPCGVAVSDNVFDAYKKAHKTDPVSSFGGIVGVSRTVDDKVASEINKTFIEAVLAPSYTETALEILKKKRNIRILEINLDGELEKETYRWINGGLLVQDNDILHDDESEWKVVTKREPTKEEWSAMAFAFKVVKFVKSNGICIATSSETLGIGVGQPNRVGALKIAINNMKDFNFTPENAALASDGFFPFKDSIDEAHKAGIRAIIEPGGSIRDQEVIDAADGHNIVMVCSNRRHFRH